MLVIKMYHNTPKKSMQRIEKCQFKQKQGKKRSEMTKNNQNEQ